MKKPLIGITVDCQHDPEDARTRGKLELNWNYAQAVSDAGGVPILIPPTADMEVLAEVIHGWLIPGGNDIDASQFGEENHPKVILQDPARFEGEARLYKAIGQDLPVFGICYGCQFLNVVNGGSLEQHLPDRADVEVHTGGILQTYDLKPSHFESLVGVAQMTGKSYHHQAVGRLGDGLRVIAEHEDGTVEGVESVDRPWTIGVQWHPERTLHDETTKKLFRAFIEASREYAHSRSTPGRLFDSKQSVSGRIESNSAAANGPGAD